MLEVMTTAQYWFYQREHRLPPRYADVQVFDLTRGYPWWGFHYDYDHGGIPIPGMPPGTIASSVGGIWCGLQLRELDPQIRPRFFRNQGRGRNIRPNDGRIIGYQFGSTVIDWLQARYQILLPAYQFVLEQRLAPLVAELATLHKQGAHVLLLDESEHQIESEFTHAQVSLAWLTTCSIEGCWPTWSAIQEEEEV